MFCVPASLFSLLTGLIFGLEEISATVETGGNGCCSVDVFLLFLSPM